MSDSTVVCWDGSDEAETALAWALRRSRDAGTTVEILDVVDTSLFLGDPRALDRATSEEEDSLAELVGSIDEEHPGALSGHHLVAGDPLQVMSEQTTPGTLVVVGTRRRVGPLVRYGWSTGARLASAAAGPVAIVPDEDRDGGPARSGVVVGVDGSDIGRLALAFAIDEAWSLDQPLHIVHCWQAPLANDPLVVPDDDFVDSQQLEHQVLLDDHVRIAHERRPGLSIRSSLLRRDPIDALRAESGRSRALVVGSRRLVGWKRAWLGSVSHGLVLGLTAPTVVVGPETVIHG